MTKMLEHRGSIIGLAGFCHNRIMHDGEGDVINEVVWNFLFLGQGASATRLKVKGENRTNLLFQISGIGDAKNVPELFNLFSP